MKNSEKTFATESEMVRQLGLERDHWINKEAAEYLSRKFYNRTEQLLQYYPGQLDELKFTCANDHIFKPDWLKKRTPSLPYLEPNSNLLLQPVEGKTTCPECGDLVKVPYPTSDWKNSEALIYGDEACREHDGKLIYSYSMINRPRNSDHHKKIYAEFINIKHELVPSLNPKKWTLHCLELFSGNKREKKKHFKHITYKQLLNFKRRLGALLENNEDIIYKWNCSGVYFKPNKYKKSDDRALKSRVYSPLLIWVISEITKNGLSPTIHFERTGTDGWATNLFTGGRLTLMWPFISHGIPVRSPQFVQPEDSIYLELADFVSYTIARYLFLTSKISTGVSMQYDVDPASLGVVRYLGYKENGVCFNRVQKGYPLETFFKGTSWESVQCASAERN